MAETKWRTAVPNSFQSVRGLGVFVFVALLLIIPFVVSDFYTGLMIDIMILALFGMSFNLLFGRTGLLSFGHAAYYGLGAYLMAMFLSGQAFVPLIDSYLLAVVLAVVGTGVGAAVIGRVCVERGGIIFAILTLAFNMLLYVAANSLTNLTQGSNGITVSSQTIGLGILSIETMDATSFYYFTLIVVVAGLLVLHRIYRSSYGEMLLIIGENPGRAEFIGLNVKHHQWSAFILSGMLAGLAGALVSTRLFIVSPSLLHWTSSADPILITIIGGASSFVGPVLGAAVFVVLQELTSSFTDHWHVFVGAFLILIVLFAPGGLVELLQNSWKNMAGKFRDVWREQ